MPLLGSTLNFSVDVYDKDPDNGGVLATAQFVTLNVTVPDGVGTVVSATVQTPSIGVYTASYQTDVTVGRYVGLWTITMPSGYTTVYSQVIEVSGADPGYILSLKAAKKHLNIPSTDTTQDEEILSWLGAITEIIEFYCGACVPRTVTNEYHDEPYVMYLNTTPVLSIVSMVPFVTYGRNYTPTELVWLPDGRVQTFNRWPFYYGPYLVTYTVGRMSIPNSLINAVKIILQHMWDTQRGASSLPFQSQDTENVPVGMGYLVPNRALELMKATDLGPSNA